MLPPGTCPKCGGRMAPGFIPDRDYGSHYSGKWVDGPAKRSVWGGVKIRGRKALKIETFRCERCSFLESYAPD